MNQLNCIFSPTPKLFEMNLSCLTVKVVVTELVSPFEMFCFQVVIMSMGTRRPFRVRSFTHRIY